MPPSQTGSISGLNFGVSPDRMGHRGSDDFQFDGCVPNFFICWQKEIDFIISDE